MLNYLITLGSISLAMSAVIILMLALQKPIKKRFAALARYIIWSVIIIRLCLPVSLDILPKLITLPGDIPEEETVIYEPVTPEVIPEAEYTPEAPAPSVPSEIINEPVTDNMTNESYIPSTPTAEPVATKPAFKLTFEHVTVALFAVWATGAVSFTVFTLVRYRINAKRLDETLGIPTPEIWSIYDTVCRELGIKKAPPLYMSRADVSPMVYGFIDPKVILPSVEMSAQSTAYILRHELTHYKRGDLYFKLIAMLANALHWFNPLAYAACGMMSAEAELSCDETVLRKTDLMGRLGYGNSMLEIVKLCKHSPKLTTGFSPKKRAVKERFENMINTTKKKKGYWIVAITLICALLCTSIIGCTTKDAEPKDTDDTAETEDAATEEYDAVGWIENIEGEEQYDWYLRVENDVMTLGHNAEDGSSDLCYRYGDSSKHEDVIDLKPVLRMTEDNKYSYMLRGWISADYALIEYDAPIESIEDCKNIYFATIDLRDGSVTNEIRYEVDDILSLHGLDRDVLAVYESWGGNAPEYSIDCNVLRFEMSGEAPSNKLGMYYRLINKDQRRAEFSVYFDMVTGELSDIEMGHCNLVKYTSNDVVTDISDISKIEGIDENTVKAAEAFLAGDTPTLQKLGGYEPGFLDDLKSIKFGDYRISKLINDRGLQLETYVTESMAYNVDKGLHTFSIGDTGVSHDCVECLYPEIEDFYYAETDKMAKGWATFSGTTVVPIGEAYTDEDFNAVVRFLHYIYNTNTVDEYRQYAKKAFGIDILTENYTDNEAEKIEADLIDIYGTDSNTGNPYIEGYLVDAGEDFVTYQFYADEGRFIPAYKVKYEFTKEEDEFFFKSCNILEDTGRLAYGTGLYQYEYEYEVISD